MRTFVSHSTDEGRSWSPPMRLHGHQSVPDEPVEAAARSAYYARQVAMVQVLQESGDLASASTL